MKTDFSRLRVSLKPKNIHLSKRLMRISILVEDKNDFANLKRLVKKGMGLNLNPSKKEKSGKNKIEIDANMQKTAEQMIKFSKLFKLMEELKKLETLNKNELSKLGQLKFMDDKTREKVKQIIENGTKKGKPVHEILKDLISLLNL